MDLQEHETLQYCLPSGNGSCPKEVRQKTTYVTLYFLLVTVVLITVCGNLAVIISISHFKKLHTPTNLLVLSLAFTDLSVGVFTMPLTLIKIIESCWYFGDIICFAYVLVSYLLITLSVTHLIFIAIDRYFAICDPLLYSVKITVPVTFFFIVIVWILSILYIFILVSCNGYISGVKMSVSCTEDCNYTLGVTWWAIDAAVIFFLPCSVMVGLYGKIFVVARRHALVTLSSSISMEGSDVLRPAYKYLAFLRFSLLASMIES
nr:PREDICTED: trace amine-associated receptor 13c-like [Lepisosteus oculatus]